MDIITKTGEIWSENAIGAVISLIKESDDSVEAERKLTHWLTEMNCQLIAMALARIDTELYQIYIAFRYTRESEKMATGQNW